MKNNISFCTPVKSNNTFISAAEGYLTLSNACAVVVDGSEHLVEKHLIPTSWVTSALKVVSWFLTLGILPLIALCIKAAHRASHDYHYSARDTAIIIAIDLLKELGGQDVLLAKGPRELKEKIAIMRQNIEFIDPSRLMNLMAHGMIAARELNLQGVENILPFIANGRGNDKQNVQLLTQFAIANPQLAQKTVEIILRAVELSVIEGHIPSKFLTVTETFVNNSGLIEIPLREMLRCVTEEVPRNQAFANMLENLATPKHVQAALSIEGQLNEIAPLQFPSAYAAHLIPRIVRNSNLIVAGMRECATIVRNAENRNMAEINMRQSALRLLPQILNQVENRDMAEINMRQLALRLLPQILNQVAV